MQIENPPHRGPRTYSALVEDLEEKLISYIGNVNRFDIRPILILCDPQITQEHLGAAVKHAEPELLNWLYALKNRQDVMSLTKGDRIEVNYKDGEFGLMNEAEKWPTAIYQGIHPNGKYVEVTYDDGKKLSYKLPPMLYDMHVRVHEQNHLIE